MDKQHTLKITVPAVLKSFSLTLYKTDMYTYYWYNNIKLYN